VKNLLHLVAAFLLGIHVLGCGLPPSNIAPVRGRVTLGGEPLVGGNVLFMPTSVGKPSRGQIQPDGSFLMTTKAEFDGAVIGRHEVEIHNAEFATPLRYEADQTRRRLLAKPRVVVVEHGENLIDLSY
jgi:hypothetical protein